ncbi:MAG: cupin domain-containing protein, partial [Candidatus Omnitrophota bacterium]
HEKLMDIFDSRAISYKSLIRIEKGRLDGRLNSIHQIACGLDMDVKELLADTERAMPREKGVLADMVQKKTRRGKFTYSDKAFIEILSSPRSSFIGMELVLEPGGATRSEEDPRQTEKLLIVTKGKITTHVHDEVHTIAFGDSIYFESHLPHYFENQGNKTARGILIQSPKSF